MTEPAQPTWTLTASGTDEGLTHVHFTANLDEPTTDLMQALGMWAYIPVLRDPDVPAALAAINQKLETIMALVKVEQAALDAFDTALDEATASLAAKIAALELPAASLTALNEDLDALRALAAPAPVEPPAEEPPA